MPRRNSNAGRVKRKTAKREKVRDPQTSKQRRAPRPSPKR